MDKEAIERYVERYMILDDTELDALHLGLFMLNKSGNGSDVTNKRMAVLVIRQLIEAHGFPLPPKARQINIGRIEAALLDDGKLKKLERDSDIIRAYDRYSEQHPAYSNRAIEEEVGKQFGIKPRTVRDVLKRARKIGG